MSNKEYLEFAKKLALEAGEKMRYFRKKGLFTQNKSDGTVVSEADYAINSLVIAKVSQKFPNHGVLGEEESVNENAEYIWICDPIDGTAAYLLNLPTSTFMICLNIKGQPQVSVVHNPWTGDLYYAAKGEGAWLGEDKLSVSKRDKAEMNFISGVGATTSNRLFIDSPTGIEELKKRGWHTVNFHGIGQKGTMIASGSIDGALYNHTGPHDIAPLDLLITEAGGKVTDFSGKEIDYTKPFRGAILSNGKIHNDLIEIVRKIKS